MGREIVLDTETTGFDPLTGDRLVELVALEIESFVPTGRSFHAYIDPCRDMPAEAERVHGLTAGFLKGKPRFEDPEVVDRFLEFVGDAPIIAHNAGFDRGFLNWELSRCGRIELPEPRWIDTLGLAKKRFPGMHNSLDALCKRFRISLSDREKHGALIDAKLLAAVYLELKGGREAGRKFIEALTLFSHLANIGDAKSLVIHPATTTHFRMDDAALAAAGIGPGTIRLSIGLEHPDDLIDDLGRALNASQK